MTIEPGGMEAKIIDAAVECIEKYGIQATTTRRIAEQAGVNIAAINYYFRSKDLLLERVIQFTLANAFDWKDFSSIQADTAQEKCSAIFENLVQGACQFPGITRYHFNEIIEGQATSLTHQKFDEFMLELSKFMRANGVQKEENELRQVLGQIASACMMICLAPGLFQNNYGLDMHNETCRHTFIQNMVNQLFR